MISQVPSSSQRKEHSFGDLEACITLVERFLIFHGFRLDDAQPTDDVGRDDALLGLFYRRQTCIEKILLDNGLMQPDDPDTSTYTGPSKVISRL